MTTTTKTTFRIRDRRGGSRYFIDNALLRGGWGARVGPYGIAVYNALALHVDADSQDGYPSYATIAKLTGMSERQAMRKVDELASYNIINKEPRTDETTGQQTSNDYALMHVEVWIEQPYDSQSPRAMTDSHPPYDSQSPKQDPINKTPLNKKDGANAAQPIKAMPKKLDPKPAGAHIYREHAHLWPVKSWWPKLDAAVGDDPTRLELWGKVVEAWVGLGWNPRNIKTMLEYFDRGEIPATNGGSNGTYKRRNGQNKKPIHAATGFNPYTQRTEPMPTV